MLTSMAVLCYALHTGDVGKSAPFLYQLQNAHYQSLQATPFGIAVVDWEDAELTGNEVRSIKAQGKTLVSYLSIGEAEDYRDYWKDEWNTSAPMFLEEENEDWPGNFKVHYWDNDWQGIILQKVQAIVKKGYDGVYLDIIDGYWYFQEKGRKTARQEMIDFVIRISETAKAINPGFLIIPQNSPELVEDAQYMQSIDGLGKEDTWYNDDQLQAEDNKQYELSYLRQAKEAGKFVLAVDYPENIKHQKDFLQKTIDEGFIPFIGTRELDTNNISPLIVCK